MKTMAERVAKNHQTIFKVGLHSLINRKIAALKADDVVAMGADNLWKLCACDASKLTCAPVGTNGAYFARQVFNELIAGNPFILIETTRSPKSSERNL